MMKMATGERSPPSDRVPKQAPERFLVATEACGSGTPDLLWRWVVVVGIVVIGIALVLN